MFLGYEEMLRDPVGTLRTMAEFIGCTFSPEEEEEQGVDRAIAELCSMKKLKNVDANRKGQTGSGVKADAFFQQGVAGDWSSHMTPEMGKMVDQAVEDGLRGSGFSFAESTPANPQLCPNKNDELKRTHIVPGTN
ncbi:cytosolic sulfotransferase 8-like [Triticum aestivum]|uniref:cytosolic sulfotransferase 8-like n=1 Tax=Triticum aestivum TaxID=4565 RepID=UPI001D029D39|nr:cytosolic sulfotransferase 8-like [Triticum aestivum]